MNQMSTSRKPNKAPGIAARLGLLTIDAAARECGVAVITLRRLKKQHLVSYTRIGRNICFDLALLDKELKEYGTFKQQNSERSLLAVRAEAQSKIINSALARLKTMNDDKVIKIKRRLEKSQKAEAKD